MNEMEDDGGGYNWAQPSQFSRNYALANVDRPHMLQVGFVYELPFGRDSSGIVPSIILPLIREYWDSKLHDIFMRAEHARVHNTSDVVLILAVVAALSSETPVPNINHTTMNKILERITPALDGKAKGLPARALLVNLSAQMGKFHDALRYYHLQAEPLVEVTRKPKSKQRPAKR